MDLLTRSVMIISAFLSGVTLGLGIAWLINLLGN